MDHKKENYNAKIPLKETKPATDEHDWFAEICQASNIHGMPYVARKDLHWVERIFWLSVAIAAAFYSISSCLSQWERFRNNPIIYEYEYLYGLRDFNFMGISFCAEYEMENITNKLAYEIWGNNIGDSVLKLAYYRQFLYVLGRLHYNNLDLLAPYANDTTLDELNFLDILLKLKRQVITKPDAILASFAPSITEMGLCMSSSTLNHYTNPYGKIEHINVTAIRKCGYFNDCKYKYKPLENVIANLTLYVHDANEIMLPEDRHTAVFNAGSKSSYELKLILNPISAQVEVQNLPVDYRKCRYEHENNLDYFTPYRPSLCRLECRINVALALCRCKPYFYAGGPKGRMCNIRGMLCLHQKQWLNKTCSCWPLCIETSYLITEKYAQNSFGGEEYTGETFDRTIVVKLELPKMGIKRRVVFSIDQLIMSFGGAIGLFLGASFMTIYSLIYLLFYFLVVKSKSKCKPHNQEKRNNSCGENGHHVKQVSGH